MPDDPNRPHSTTSRDDQFFSNEDRRAFGVGAWTGVCVAVAAITALGIIYMTTPSGSQLDPEAQAPTSTVSN